MDPHVRMQELEAQLNGRGGILQGLEEAISNILEEAQGLASEDGASAGPSAGEGSKYFEQVHQSVSTQLRRAQLEDWSATGTGEGAGDLAADIERVESHIQGGRLREALIEFLRLQVSADASGPVQGAPPSTVPLSPGPHLTTAASLGGIQAVISFPGGPLATIPGTPPHALQPTAIEAVLEQPPTPSAFPGAAPPSPGTLVAGGGMSTALVNTGVVSADMQARMGKQREVLSGHCSSSLLAALQDPAQADEGSGVLYCGALVRLSHTTAAGWAAVARCLKQHLSSELAKPPSAQPAPATTNSAALNAALSGTVRCLGQHLPLLSSLPEAPPAAVLDMYSDACLGAMEAALARLLGPHAPEAVTPVHLLEVHNAPRRLKRLLSEGALQRGSGSSAPEAAAGDPEARIVHSIAAAVHARAASAWAVHQTAINANIGEYARNHPAVAALYQPDPLQLKSVSDGARKSSTAPKGSSKGCWGGGRGGAREDEGGAVLPGVALPSGEDGWAEVPRLAGFVVARGWRERPRRGHAPVVAVVGALLAHRSVLHALPPPAAGALLTPLLQALHQVHVCIEENMKCGLWESPPWHTYLHLSSITYILHGLHAVHHTLAQSRDATLHLSLLTLVRSCATSFEDLAEVAAEHIVTVHTQHMRDGVLASLELCAWQSHRAPAQSKAAAALQRGPAMVMWQVQLASTLHSLARVCSSSATEAAFSGMLHSCLEGLSTRYLSLTPSPQWLPRFCLDIRAILSILLSYRHKLPGVAGVVIPTSPPKAKPPPVEPAEFQHTAAGGVYVLRLVPVLNALGPVCRRLCTRAALLACSTQRFLALLPSIAAFHRRLSEEPPATPSHASPPRSPGIMRRESFGNSVGSGMPDEAGAQALDPARWGWVGEERREALQGPPVRLGEPFNPLEALAPLDDPAQAPSPTALPRPAGAPPLGQAAWDDLMEALLADVDPAEASAALWHRWETCDGDTIILVEDEHKQAHDDFQAGIDRAGLASSKDVLLDLTLV